MFFSQSLSLNKIVFFCRFNYLFIVFFYWTFSIKKLFFSHSVLKIVGELNSGLPSKVVKDFSMMTQRNNNVSIMFIYLQ